MGKTALIFGVTGQDGSYLTEFLLKKNYKVVGVTRRSSTDTTERIKYAKQDINFVLEEGDVTDYSSVYGLFAKYKPDEVYNLAAQSHVGTSFKQPAYTFEVNAKGPLNILEVMRTNFSSAKMYQACHDIKTQALTPDGIKNYTDLNIGDLVYTLNEDSGAIELKPIKKILSYDYNGDMIYLESRRINQLVTPNHKIILSNDNGGYERCEAQNLKLLFKYDRTSKYSMPTGITVGNNSEKIKLKKPPKNSNHYKNLIKEIESNLYAIIMGLYLGDGYIKSYIKKSSMSREERQKYRDENGRFSTITKPKKKIKEYSTRVEFAIPKNDKARNLICNTLSKANIEYDSNDTIVWFSCYGLSKKLQEDCGRKFDGKYISDWIYNKDRQFLENLLTGLLYSDGDAKRQYYTSNEKLAVGVIRLIYSLGYHASLQIDDELRSVWFEKDRRYINKTTTSYIIGIGYSGKNKLYKNHITNKKYNDKVWCLEVEDNHNFMIIRDGKIAISGNSTSEMFGSNYSIKTIAKEVDVDCDLLNCKAVMTYGPIKCQNEDTPFSPNSPYAAAKLAAHNLVKNYRDAYGLHASSGVLFNHESERRGEQFVTRKITKWFGEFSKWYEPVFNLGQLVDRDEENYIYKGLYGADGFPKLRLGNLDAERDWGHAEDYVRAMWLMLQQDNPDDYVVATGESHTVREFLDEVFSHYRDENYPEVKMDWESCVVIDPQFYRPSEVEFLKGDASKAKKVLGWEPKVSFKELVKRMVEADLNG